MNHHRLYSTILSCICLIFSHAQAPDLVVQSSHNNDLSALEISPNGRLMATTAEYDGNNILITELRSGLVYADIREATDAVTAIRFLGNDTLVFGSDDGYVRVYDLIKAQLITQWETQRGVEHIAVKGNRVLVGQYQLEEYDLLSGELLHELENPVPRTITYLKDGRIACNVNGHLRLLSADFKELDRIKLSNEYIREIHEIKSKLFVIAYDGMYLLNKNQLDDSSHLNFERWPAENIDIYQDLILMQFPRSLIIYDAGLNEVVQRIERSTEFRVDRIENLKFIRKGSHLLWNMGPTEYHIIQRDPLTKVGEIIQSNPTKVYSFVFHPHEDAIILGGFRRMMHLNLQSGMLNELPRPDGIPWQMEIDANRLSVLEGDELVLYSLDEWKVLDRIVSEEGIKQFHWAANGKSVYLLDDEGMLERRFIGEDGSSVIFDLPSDEALHFDLHPSGERLVVAMGFDKNALEFETEKGREIRELIPPPHIHKIELIEGMNRAAFEMMENAKVVGNQVHMYSKPSMNILRCEYDNRGETIAVIDAKKHFVWDADGKVIQRMESSGQLPWLLSLHPEKALSASSGMGSWPGLNTATQELFSIHLYPHSEGQSTQKLIGHTDQIIAVDFSRDGKFLASSSEDGSFRIWDPSSGDCLWTMTAVQTGHVIVDVDGYYLTTREGIEQIAFRKDGVLISPEQLDPLLNRPDLVLGRLAYAEESMIKAYQRAHAKRLKKMGFEESELLFEFNLPSLELLDRSSIPLISKEKKLNLHLNLSDESQKLKRVMVWINDVAVFGTTGIYLENKNTQHWKLDLDLNLAYGINRIQLSVINTAGVESYREELNVECTAGKLTPDLYVLSLGVSDYQDDRFDLRYAAKDAQDVVTTLQSSGYFGQVHQLSLLDDKVVREGLIAASEFLEQADIDDQVIVFVAGHGLLDEELDYYYAAHDMDFEHPAAKGIAYESIEALLDGISPLKKLLFMDTCHSGELDDDDTEDNPEPINAGLVAVADPLSVKVRSRGVVVDDWNQNHEQIGLQNSLDLMKSLFADLRKGTGATVIAASGGLEFALESEEWQNGLFTYCLLSGLSEGRSDLDGDGQIFLNELQEGVFERVLELSGGSQQPTSRMSNRSMNYRLW